MDSILNNMQPISVIPSFASVEEHALYTIASVEECYTDICKQIGIEELAACLEAEGDESKINLKARVKAVLAKLVDFVKGLWQRFQDLVRTARDKFANFVTDKVKAYSDKKVKPEDLKKAIEASTDKQWDALSKGYTMDDNAISKADGIAKEVIAATQKVVDKISAAKDDPSKIEEIDVNEIFGTAALKKFNIPEADYGNASKIQKTIKEQLISKVERKNMKGWVASNIGDIANNVNDRNAIKKFTNACSKPYNDTKKALDDVIKAAKKVENDKQFAPLFKAAASVTRINSALIGGIEGAFFTVFAYEFKIVLKAYAINAFKKANAASEEKKVGESAEVAPEPGKDETPVTESSTFQTELASLFNF